MEKMTIHRALSELKLIDAKIEKAISEILPTGVFQKTKLINGLFKEDEFKQSSQSKFDRVGDLLLRKVNIKSAIVKANSQTKVKVAEKEMTIADAITQKGTIILKKKFVEELRKKHNNAIAVMRKNNDTVDKNVQSILEATFGKENVKAGKDDVESVRKPYMEANEFHLFDPLSVDSKIEALEKEIGDFEAEVDAVLSEINAITIIEI